MRCCTCTGSQCRSCNTIQYSFNKSWQNAASTQCKTIKYVRALLTWSRGPSRATSLAAAFCTRCKGAMVVLGRPASIALQQYSLLNTYAETRLMERKLPNDILSILERWFDISVTSVSQLAANFVGCLWGRVDKSGYAD